MPRRPAAALALAALAWAMLAGCNRRPHAPGLGGPVYQNDREGFRFLVPEGWSQRARADVPPGKYPKERLLVAYHQSGGKAAQFEVTLADLPEGTDLAALLAEPSYGITAWRPTGGPDEVDMNGTPGRRYVHSGRAGREERLKEVVAVRRGERTYFFTAVLVASDTEAREQIRRTVAGITWK